MLSFLYSMVLNKRLIETTFKEKIEIIIFAKYEKDDRLKLCTHISSKLII